jgi:hypothetical protein
MAKLDTKTRASIAALTRSATEDTVAMTEPARSAFRQSFVNTARAGAPPGTPEAEVLRRAAALRKLYYKRLSAAGVAARTRKGRASKDNPTQEGA